MPRKTVDKMSPQERLDRIVQLLAKAYLELRYRNRRYGKLTPSEKETNARQD